MKTKTVITVLIAKIREPGTQLRNQKGLVVPPKNNKLVIVPIRSKFLYS
jgi:hypothetical protein